MGNKEQLQETYMEYQMIEQHTKQFQKQLESMTQQMLEMKATVNSLDEFSNVKKGQKILVPLSSGLFANATIEDTSQLLVNVGAGVVVTKDIKSAQNLISGQIEQMKQVQNKMMGELEKLALRASQIEKEIEKLQG